MTQHARAQIAGEFLHVWTGLAEAGDTARLEAWEAQFPHLAKSDPDTALEILQALSASNTRGATEAAAIYARFVFHTRRQEITDLLITLYQHGDPEIKSRVIDTIDVITTDQNLTSTQADHLISEVKQTGTG